QPLLHAGIGNQDGIVLICSLAALPFRGQHPHYTKRNIANPNHAVERIIIAKEVSYHGFTQDGHLGVVFDVAIINYTSLGYVPVAYMLTLRRGALHQSATV